MSFSGKLATRIISRMSKTRLSVTVLLGIGIAFGFAILWLFLNRPILLNLRPLKEIHVDRRCKILLDESTALSDSSEQICEMTTLSAILRASSLRTISRRLFGMA